jgi:hypothetical protein
LSGTANGANDANARVSAAWVVPLPASTNSM